MDKISNLKKEIVNILDLNKALDIVTINLEGKSSMADYMIVASGTSSRIYKHYPNKFLKILKKWNKKL